MYCISNSCSIILTISLHLPLRRPVLCTASRLRPIKRNCFRIPALCVGQRCLLNLDSKYTLVAETKGNVRRPDSCIGARILVILKEKDLEVPQWMKETKNTRTLGFKLLD